ncbi:MAG: hypothetical protein ABIO65_06810 [Nitrospiria bacterium]
MRYLLVAIMMGLAAGAPTMAGAIDSDAQGNRTISGVVTDIASGSVFVKTEEGTTRNFGTAQVAQEQLQGLKVGDQVTLDVDEGNQVRDIDSAHASGTEGRHLVSGTIVGLDLVNKMVTLATQEGQRVSYHWKDAAAKITSKDIGDQVTLRIDEENNLAMDVVN